MSGKNSRKSGKSKGDKETNTKPNPFTLRDTQSNVSKGDRNINSISKSRVKTSKDK